MNRQEASFFPITMPWFLLVPNFSFHNRYERIMQQYSDITGGAGVGSSHHHHQNSSSSGDPFDAYSPRRLLSHQLNSQSGYAAQNPSSSSANPAPVHHHHHHHQSLRTFPSILRYMGTSGKIIHQNFFAFNFPFLLNLDSPVGGHGSRATAVTVQNSASQTLSDLAQAASNQLMAENGSSGSNAAAASATATEGGDSAAAGTSAGGSGGGNSFESSRESSVERDDPLLSDHPYGLPSYRTRVRRLLAAANARPPSAAAGSDRNASSRGEVK